MYFQNNFPILRRIESYMVIVHMMYIVQLHISCKSLCNHKFSIVSTQFFNFSETFFFSRLGAANRCKTYKIIFQRS